MKSKKVHQLRLYDRILVYKSDNEGQSFDDYGYQEEKIGNYTKEVWVSVTDKEYVKENDSSYWYIEVNHCCGMRYKPGSILSVKTPQ